MLTVHESALTLSCASSFAVFPQSKLCRRLYFIDLKVANPCVPPTGRFIYIKEGALRKILRFLNGPAWGKRSTFWSRNDPKMLPNWFQKCPKWSKNQFFFGFLDFGFFGAPGDLSPAPPVDPLPTTQHPPRRKSRIFLQNFPQENNQKWCLNPPLS